MQLSGEQGLNRFENQKDRPKEMNKQSTIPMPIYGVYASKVRCPMRIKSHTSSLIIRLILFLFYIIITMDILDDDADLYILLILIDNLNLQRTREKTGLYA